MGVDSIIIDYCTKIDNWFKSTGEQTLVILWQGAPEIFLIRYVQKHYSDKNCYWLIFSDLDSLFKIAAPLTAVFPHLKNIDQLLNPLGISVFSLYKTSYLWIALDNHIENILANFDYDLQQVLNLNIFQWGALNYPKQKPWYQKNLNKTSTINQVSIVGSGIAGAITAYFLAKQGIKVTILEKESTIASKASGNYQGIMYAKVSPYNTLQTELLYQSYGLSLSLLTLMDSESRFSNRCGVLHLDYSSKEKARNQQLSAKNYHLYKYLMKEQATQLAGVPIDVNGLFWMNGAWVQPKSWIEQIIREPNIEIKTNFEIIHLEYVENTWLLWGSLPKQILKTDALVLALGADENKLYAKFGLNFQTIGGQTSLIKSNQYSEQLSIVLSGGNYISPMYQNIHCYGATFHPKNDSARYSLQDDLHNLRELKQLNPKLYDSFTNNKRYSNRLKGHYAIRCDSFDHLPVVGSVGDVSQMRNIYAKLALDKNYRLQEPCPYWPNLYVNTAHSSRGLLTASLCSLGLVAEMLDLPNPLGLKLRQALSPNRLIINDIIRGRVS